MKRTLLFLLAGSALSLAAQQGQAWVAGYVGQTTFDSDAKILGFKMKEQVHGGAGLGYWYTDRWGLELRVLQNDLKLDAPGAGRGNEVHALLSGLFNLRAGAENWHPYLTAGLGGTNIDKPFSFKSEATTRFNYHAGLGIMGKFADRWMLDLSGRAVRVEMPRSRTEYLASLGLGYTWTVGR